MSSLDRIEKQVALRATFSRVWQAIANAKELGSWFGINLGGDSVLGKQIVGTLNTEINKAAIIEYQEKRGLTRLLYRLLAEIIHA